ncbi:uncharacterized protein [Elaeis guineensis]|uniref:uncharacterized protein n=1 Tax=Elaeis guineensis var. tenera TaxID=51953 RepID=UPI003C6D3DBB
MTSGNVVDLNQLVRESPIILFSKTLDNTALHIVVTFEHEQFAKDLRSSSPSLLLTTNSNGETSLRIGTVAGRHSMATFFIRAASEVPPHGNNIEGALLALELLQAEHEQSKLINNHLESPMFLAVFGGKYPRGLGYP